MTVGEFFALAFALFLVVFGWAVSAMIVFAYYAIASRLLGWS